MGSENGPNKSQIEALYASIVGTSSDAIISKNLDGIIQTWNRGAENIFGWTADEIIGKSLTMIIPDHLLQEEVEIIAKLRRKETIDQYETIRRTKDGRLINISVTVSPIMDENGVVIGGSKIARDITDQFLMNKERAILAAIVSSSDDAIISKDLEGKVQTWNQSAERIFGYTAAEMIGKPIALLVPPEIPSEEPFILAKIKRGERVDHYETIRQAKDGRRIDISLSISPIRDANGTIIGASKIARDITEQKSIKRKAERLEELNRMKSAFFSTMSHEIRSPLGGIIGLADILTTEEGMPEEAKELAGDILEASQTLYKVLNELLDFSKLEAGKIALESQPFSPRELINEVIRVANPERLNRGLDLRSIIDPDVPETLIGDELRVRQVLMNLATNAIKFSEQGAVYIAVNVIESKHQKNSKHATETKQSKDDSSTSECIDFDANKITLEFKVIDTGIGMSEDTLERLFQPFVQADASTTRLFGGTGLGLSISKSYVDLMDGEIGVNSEPGKGSTFWFRVPFQTYKNGVTKSHDTIDNAAI